MEKKQAKKEKKMERKLGLNVGFKTLHAIKVYKNTQAISHLMYADDLLLMRKTSRTEAQSFKIALTYTASGRTGD